MFLSNYLISFSDTFVNPGFNRLRYIGNYTTYADTNDLRIGQVVNGITVVAPTYFHILTTSGLIIRRQKGLWYIDAQGRHRATDVLNTVNITDLIRTHTVTSVVGQLSYTLVANISSIKFILLGMNVLNTRLFTYDTSTRLLTLMVDASVIDGQLITIVYS